MTTPSSLAAFVQEERKNDAIAASLDTLGSQLLRRAALVRWFDEQIYRDALARDLEGAPAFETFVKRPEISIASGREGTYVIRDAVRVQQLDRWRNDRTGLQKFSAQLVQFYEGRHSPIDVFAHRIFADPAKAVAEFDRLYEEADQHFDLVQCDALLRVLRNRGDQRGLPLTEALNNREQYFQSRSLFADDWMRTAHFLDLPKVTKRFDTFLGDPGKWIFRLYAAGGAGKTAYLRWLIARYCVPERGEQRARIPVARVDLDFVHVPAVAAAPWLLLVQFADQLNPQISNAPFFTLLLSWSQFLPLLQRPVSRASAAALPSFDESREQEMISLFAASLGDEQALIVLDTLEEVILHHAEAIGKLLTGLSQVREKCKGLKLVLSGRYDPFVRDGAAGTITALKPHSDSLELPSWDRAECWDYLIGIRKLHAGMSFKEFERPARGNPFKVALFADLIGLDREFTLEHLRELRSVEVEYLVLRVIERIPESDCPLRWLLRYAVIPRQLTEEFVDQVLAPQLRRAMTASGPEAPDRPAENLPKGAEVLRKHQPWQSCGKPFETAAEWPALLRYAGPSSWITISNGLPRPQPELLSPMRYLLQEQPIFADIHREAARYFEKLAGTEGRDWGEMMCEAIYHQFQCLGSAAGDYWSACLKRKEAQNAEVRRKLAECLLSGDFLDDHDQPLQHKKTGTVLTGQTLAEAYLELAALDVRESIDATNVVAAGGLMERSAKRLAQVRALERKHGFQIPSDGRRALVEASLSALTDLDKSFGILDDALEKTADEGYRPVLLGLKANLLLTGRGDVAGAEQALQSAADCARGQEAPLVAAWRFESQLGHLAFAHDDLETAGRLFESALAATEGSKISDTDLRQLVETVTEIDRSSANWSRAVERLRKVEDATGLSFAQLRAQLFLDANAPGEAIQLTHENTASDKRIQGQAAAVVGEFTRAANLLEDAWKSSIGDPSAAAQARFEQIRLILIEMRDYRQARSLLGNLRDLGEYRINAEMLLLELQVRTDERDAAADGWKRLLALTEGMGPRRRATVLATGLAFELVPRSEFDNLLDAMAAVRPSGARLPLLKPFVLYEGEPTVTNGVSKHFQELFPVPGPNDPDFTGRALLLADVLRYLGDRNSAASMLKAALKNQRSNQLLRRQLINALLRLDAVLDDDELLAYANGVLSAGVEFGIIARLELAEYWIKRKQFDLAGRMLGNPPQPASQYEMRYSIARARLARAAADGDAASHFLAQAEHTAQRLGIPMEWVELGSAKPAPELFTPEHRLELWLSRPGRVQVVFQPADGPAMNGEYDLNMFSQPGFVGPEADALYAALQNRPMMSTRLAELLRITLEQRVKLGRNIDLRFELSEDDQLAALPWEWAMREPFRFVYRSPRGRDVTHERLQWFLSRLQQFGAPPGSADAAAIENAERQAGVFADGWSGVETRRNLNARRGQQMVAIVKLSTEEERSLKIGSGSASISLEDIYASRGIRFATYDPRQLNPENIQKFFQGVQLIHICLPLTELNGLLQLGSPEMTQGGLSASSFYVFNSNLPRPVVLLDPPMPARNEFWAQQLVWRNIFARHLFERYSVEAVIAAGLVHDISAYDHGIAANLAGRNSVGELIRLLNANHPESAAALYAFDPMIPLI
jgi:hypothetical protein